MKFGNRSMIHSFEKPCWGAEFSFMRDRKSARFGGWGTSTTRSSVVFVLRVARREARAFDMMMMKRGGRS